MLKDVIAVKPLDEDSLWLRFDDGVEGVVDVSTLVPFQGVFAPLKNQEFFAQVRVNQDTGTICWTNDADLDPDVLYALVTGNSIPTYVEETISA